MSRRRSLRIDPRQAAPLLERLGGLRSAFGTAASKSKYGAVRTTVFGWVYPSKLQARCAQWLRARQAAGEVRWFIEEVPFRLPGHVVHRIDFLAVLANGEVQLIDAKGRDHAMGKLKRRQVEELYGVQIQLWDGKK